MEEHPKEVRSPPLPLAGLVGASGLHSKLTEALQEGAVSNAGQRRVRYISMGDGLDLAACKRGAKDLPGYKVEGMVKRSWLEKVCSRIPAVLILCVDWSSNSQPASADQEQANSFVRRIVQTSASRELRLLVFAVTHSDAGDADALMGFLRQHPEPSNVVVARGYAELSSKAQQLERLVHQHAIAFYTDEEKRVRRLRGNSPAPTTWKHSALQARMHFKAGFLSEFRKDTRNALKSYIKAYEQLIHDTEIADVVERVGLCNIITIRMYQLYLHSHDVSAAVHHCRIHTSTLRSCYANEAGSAPVMWRKWHWLAVNHQLFAELLESVAQQLPLLIDQADMWQFPGLHYQSAANYIDILQQWARSYVQANHKPPHGKYGDFVESTYLGQAESLAEASECSREDLEEEVLLRHAKKQSTEIAHGDRCLNLLARALAACKERGYHSGATTCTFRMAQVYMANGLAASSGRLFARLGGSGADDSSKNRPIWLMLDRFALERCIACACHELEEEVPPAILLTRPLQDPPPKVCEIDESADAVDVDTAWQRLVKATFEYLGQQPRLPQEQQASLFKALQNVHSRHSKLHDGQPLDVPFSGAVGYIELREESPWYLFIRLQSPLQLPLAVASAQLHTPSGLVRLGLTTSEDSEEQASGKIEWPGAEDLELRGRWQELPSSLLPLDLTTVSASLSWADMPRVNFVVRDVRAGARTALLADFQFPSAGTRGGSASSSSRARRAGDQRSNFVGEATHLKGSLRCQIHCPVDPATALLAEGFVVHAALYMKAGACASQTRLSLSGYVQVQGDCGSHADESEVCRLALLKRGTSDSAGAEVGRIPVPSAPGIDASSSDTVEVAELNDGKIQPSGAVLTFTEDMLEEGSPLRPQKGEIFLLVPVLVQCGAANGSEGKVTVSLHIHCCDGPSDSVSKMSAVPIPPVIIHFRPALQVAFESRPLPGLSTAKAGPRILRKCIIKSLTTTPIEVTAVQDADGAPGKSSTRWKSGPLGRFGLQSVHVLALPPVPAEQAAKEDAGSSLLVQFHRVDQLALFFPWSGAREALSQLQLPGASAAWQLPSEPQSLAGAAADGNLQVDLEHTPTGVVGQPMQVHIRIQSASTVAQEFRARVVPADGGAASDKFFLSGSTTMQGLLLPSSKAKVQEASSVFSLIPLRPGWITIPRVQVAAGQEEAAPSPASVFIFPSPQPVVWRS